MTDTTHNLTPKTNTVGVPPTPPEAHLQAVQTPKKGKDLKQDITDKIIELMQAGPAQWQKTWAVAAANGMPVNATTGAPYRGVNILLLWVATAEAGYTTNRWMTYKQAQAVGANVRKGEKSVTCVFFDMIKKKEAQDDEAQFFPMAKAFHLFNLDQIENLPAELQADEPVTTTKVFEPCGAADDFLVASGAAITHKGGRAFYRPSTDEIYMPPREAFTTPENYYATVLHELTHWTGHASRLDRDFSKTSRFGDESYAFEELVAELGAAFLAGHFGFVASTVEDHASYMASWIKVLKNDKNAIFTAAKHAGAAMDYLLDISGSAVSQRNDYKIAA